MTTWMVETSPDFGDEHIVIHLDAGGPIELGELHESLAALASIYERRNPNSEPESPRVKLYVTRVQSGSINIELVPLIALLGMPISVMDSALIIREFSKWVGLTIRSVADQLPVRSVDLNSDDAGDLEKFIAPLKGRRGANLGIKHAKFSKILRTGKAVREVVAEYNFNESEINRVAINLQRAANETPTQPPSRNKTVHEVLMAFQQADKSPGKERGRTGDRVVISSVTDKPLPVYFPRAAADIKRRILEQTENPFAKGYIVDADVQYAGDDTPRVYTVIGLHDIVDLD